MKSIGFFCCFCSIFFGSDLIIYEDRTYTEIAQTSAPDEIASLLHAVGIRFEQWQASVPLTEESSAEEIKYAYRMDIEKLKRENGYEWVDVLRMVPDHPKKEELRKKFLNEHTHEEDEVRFFVEGSGLFFLHVEGKVFCVRCEKGDLISIPPRYPHWFDMGDAPYFTAIRFFTREDGWIAKFTGDPISEHFVDQSR